jgi:hypothetical protein
LKTKIALAFGALFRIQVNLLRDLIIRRLWIEGKLESFRGMITLTIYELILVGMWLIKVKYCEITAGVKHTLAGTVDSP